MRRTLLPFLLLFFVTLVLHAQAPLPDGYGYYLQQPTAPPQWLGVQIGFANPTLYEGLAHTDADHRLHSGTTFLRGAQVGLVYDATLIRGFGYTLGLNYTFAFGARKAHFHQLEIPIEWQYKWEVMDKAWLIVYTGPTVQCRVAWQERAADANSPATSLFDKQSHGDLTPARFGTTWGIGLGFQYKHFFLRGGYDFGLLNAYRSAYYTEIQEDGVTETSRRQYGRFDQWQIRLGYYFMQW